jgi:hypothetical protein
LTISSSWEHLKAINSDTLFFVEQSFPPDGISVIVFIKRGKKGFEVWSSAEHRISGPVDTLVAVTGTLEDGLKVAEAECHSWEIYFSENSSGNYSKPKQPARESGR